MSEFRITPCCYGCKQYEWQGMACMRLGANVPSNGLCSLFEEADPPRHGKAVAWSASAEPARAAPLPKIRVEADASIVPGTIVLRSGSNEVRAINVGHLHARIKVVVQPGEIDGKAADWTWAVEPAGIQLITPDGYLRWSLEQAIAALGPEQADLPHAHADSFGGKEALGALARFCLVDEG